MSLAIIGLFCILFFFVTKGFFICSKKYLTKYMYNHFKCYLKICKESTFKFKIFLNKNKEYLKKFQNIFKVKNI